MENIKEQFKRLFYELDLTDDQAAMIKKLQRDVDAALRQPPVSGSLQINWDDVYEEANHRSPTAFDEYVKSICNDH